MAGIWKTEKDGEEAPEENPGKRPPSPEPMFHAALPGSHPMKRGGGGNERPWQNPGRGRCRSWLEDRPVGSEMQKQGTVDKRSRRQTAKERGEGPPLGAAPGQLSPQKATPYHQDSPDRGQQTENPLKKNLHRREEQDQPRGSLSKREGHKEGSGTSSMAESKNCATQRPLGSPQFTAFQPGSPKWGRA